MHKETMTSRERVLKAINHEEADRMPIDLGVHFSTGISAAAYINLRKYLGMDVDNVELIDCIQCLARVDEDIRERFHVDTILLNPSWENPKKWSWKGYEVSVPPTFNPVEQPDGGYRMEYKGCKLRMPASGFFFDGGWPDFYDLSPEEKTKRFAKRARDIYEQTDKFTMLMGFSGYFGGLEFACDMLTDPDDVIERNERYLANNIRRFDIANEAMGKYLGAIEINSDLGHQQGPLCTPDSYEECCLPFLKKFVEHVHNTSDIKVFMHSCGAIRLMIPYIIEAGVDVLNPIQISAANMDPVELKKEFGSKICFWGGGCNTQHVLPSQSPEKVRENTLELIRAFKPGGGFVFNQVHNIMGNVPPENIVAMLDTAYENSWYD